MTTFHIPSRSFAGSHAVRFDERTGQWTCSCMGFARWHHREGFACYHIRTIQDSLSDSLLLIEGDLPAEMIRYAIGDISAGVFLIRTHWIYDHHRRARYGYVPAYGPDWRARIGLKPEARREWLQVEASAVVASLARRIETLESKTVAA